MRKNIDKIIPLHGSSDKYNAGDEMLQNVLGTRIAAARKNAGLSLVAFSKVLADYGINISSGSINKWELGDSLPNAYQLIALSHALNIEDMKGYFSARFRPDLNEEGMKKLSEYKEDLVASGRYTPVINPADEEIEYIDMPVSYLAASAGTGDFLDEGNYELVSFPACAVPSGADFGVHVNGDSMEPVYHDGQIVWVKQCSELRSGEVGIFIYDGDGYIKSYAERTPSEEDAASFTDMYGAVHKQPVMVSYNKKYPAKVISPDMGFRIVGRVLN